MNSRCWQITFNTCPTARESFENFLEDFFEVTACNYDDDGKDEYVGYLSTPPDEKALHTAASAAGIILPEYKIEQLQSTNWLKDYVIRFSPFEADEFMIYGIHEAQAPTTKKIPLQIYAATAFGSDHQTTRSCLKALCDLYRQGFSPANILDIGTGSGILSLAAAKLWPHSRITAVDIDEEAVWVTRQNAETNNITTITAEQSNGYTSPVVNQNGPYDLILANILARPLIEMAPDLSNHLRSGGYAVLSGFVEDQSEWVISSHQQYACRLVKEYQLDHWRAALLEKEN